LYWVALSWVSITFPSEFVDWDIGEKGEILKSGMKKSPNEDGTCYDWIKQNSICETPNSNYSSKINPFPPLS